MRSERDFIRYIKSRAKPKNSNPILGIGDDAAIISSDSKTNWVISSDILVENIHFRRSYFPPKSIGYKALAVNLSDMAAMGAIPRFCLMNLAIPQNYDDGFIDQLLEGFFSLADQHDVVLIGGDTSSAPEYLYIDITIIGEIVPGNAVLRSTAKEGDFIYVSGFLGNAVSGLTLLENQKPPQSSAQYSAINNHLEPIPQLFLGQVLARKQLATAMMDISDGLSIDLFRLCEASLVGAILLADQIPIAESVKELFIQDGQTPLEVSLNGGEDYVLLFTSDPGNHSQLKQVAVELKLPIFHIGYITKQREGLKIEIDKKIKPLEILGFDHFATKLF